MKVADNLTVPYLNPLVLRKELENILAEEGDSALRKVSFADDHPIIYYNLLWFMERIDVVTHLPNLIAPKQVKNFLFNNFNEIKHEKCKILNI